MSTASELLTLHIQDFLETAISNHAKATYCKTVDINRIWSVVVGIDATGSHVARVIAYKSFSGHDGFDTVKVSSPETTPKAALEDLLATLRRQI